MAWDLEHQEQVGVEEHRSGLVNRRKGINRKMLLYAGLALVPVILFGIMLLLARH
jgi:hypothetical protein